MINKVTATGDSKKYLAVKRELENDLLKNKKASTL
jgi:hypothetical protein